MKTKEKNIINYELVDILGQMYTELMSVVSHGAEYIEVSEIRTIFNCYLKDIEEMSEDLEVNFLETREDYINHYDRMIAEAKSKIRELEQQKKEVLM